MCGTCTQTSPVNFRCFRALICRLERLGVRIRVKVSIGVTQLRRGRTRNRQNTKKKTHGFRERLRETALFISLLLARFYHVVFVIVYA